MITKIQLEELSADFGIDKFTVFREYLQLVFLNNLYKEKGSEKVYFKGGTCLHLVYLSPRFSEDLDFSTLLSKKALKKLLQKIIRGVQKEIPGASLALIYSGKKSMRYKIKYQGREFKYPQTIRIDISFEKPVSKISVSKIKTKIPVSFFSLILHLTEGEILAEKTRAFLTRAKGRDVYDLWYLLSKKTPLKETVLNQKLKTVGKSFAKKILKEKIQEYPLKKLKLDLTKFLPEDHRKIIPKLKEEIINLIPR
jgi:predicted nucleotidyltransferase component of viral defense system